MVLLEVIVMADAFETAAAPVNMHSLNQEMLKAYHRELHSAADDPGRLSRVYGSYFMRASRTSRLDAICRTAAQVTASHAAEINMLTENHQVTVAMYGSQTRETPLIDSYCQHQLVGDNRPMRVGDSLESALLCSNAMANAAGIRSYLGVPLMTADGWLLGTLCVYDLKPRVWRDQDVELLSTLAAQVMELEAAGEA